MQELRIHARGGQGAVVAEELLVHALVTQGWHATGVPIFGFERRGAPVMTFVRFDSKRSRYKTLVYDPHALIVFDQTLMGPQIFDGLREDGWLVINAGGPPDPAQLHPNVRHLAYVDATRIAVELFGSPIPNTAMLAAMGAATGWFTLDSLVTAIRERWSGRLQELNIRAAERGFSEVQLQDLRSGQAVLAAKGGAHV